MGLSGSKLYRLSGGTVIPASEALYPAEADLQQLIAENPQLLLSSPNEGQRLYLLASRTARARCSRWASPFLH